MTRKRTRSIRTKIVAEARSGFDILLTGAAFMFSNNIDMTVLILKLWGIYILVKLQYINPRSPKVALKLLSYKN